MPLAPPSPPPPEPGAACADPTRPGRRGPGRLFLKSHDGKVDTRGMTPLRRSRSGQISTMTYARSSLRCSHRPGQLRALAGGLLACLALSGCAALGSLGGPRFPAFARRVGQAGRGDLPPGQVDESAASNARFGPAKRPRRGRELHVAIVRPRGARTRADAVSALAEARISVEHARTSAPWRRTEISEATEKLEEAERQFQTGNPGSAVFFASRAQRISDALREEARRVTGAAGARVVTALARISRRSFHHGPRAGRALGGDPRAAAALRGRVGAGAHARRRRRLDPRLAARNAA